MRNIAEWKRWFADNSDLITPVRTTADIRRKKAEEKTDIILGFRGNHRRWPRRPSGSAGRQRKPGG